MYTVRVRDDNPGQKSDLEVTAQMASYDDVMVAQKINQYILDAYQAMSKNGGNPTVAEVLDKAQAEAQKGRKGSFDKIGRDVEYYLKSRAGVAKRGLSGNLTQGPGLGPLALRKLNDDYKALIGGGGIALNVIYNGLKAGMIGLGGEELMRTDPDVMVSPPGGLAWGAVGAADGMMDIGSSQQMPRQCRVPKLTP